LWYIIFTFFARSSCLEWVRNMGWDTSFSSLHFQSRFPNQSSLSFGSTRRIEHLVLLRERVLKDMGWGGKTQSSAKNAPSWGDFWWKERKKEITWNQTIMDIILTHWLDINPTILHIISYLSLELVNRVGGGATNIESLRNGRKERKSFALSIPTLHRLSHKL